MALYYEWGIKNGLTFALQFFLLIFDSPKLVRISLKLRHCEKATKFEKNRQNDQTKKSAVIFRQNADFFDFGHFD